MVPLKTLTYDVDTVFNVFDHSQTQKGELAGVKGSKGKLKVLMVDRTSWLLDVTRVDGSPEDTVL